ncbi:MAG: hypothetical protein K8S98_18515 [Planctomycetes bacterium]|nr:hypothetical protein [Planctomycetota bacterium]
MNSLCLRLFVACVPSVAFAFQTTTRVSVNSAGVPAAVGYFSFAGGVSSDGRFVTFASNAPNLVAGDTTPNTIYDAFVHDRTTGVTTRVGLSSLGAQPNGSVVPTSISTDGRWIVFWSTASNLVVGDVNGTSDVFVRDELTHTTQRVDLGPGGVEATGISNQPRMTPDGASVLFTSQASNLDPAKTTTLFAPFVRNVAANVTWSLQLIPGGVQPDGNSIGQAMSSDARFFGVASLATNLTPGDANGKADVFVHDRTLGTTTLVSVDLGGATGAGGSDAIDVSDDGRYAVFASFSPDLVANDTNGTADVFLRDLQLGVTTRLSENIFGQEGDGTSYSPDLTPDARFVAFSSASTNLAPGDGNAGYDQFLYDRNTFQLEALSVTNSGAFSGGDTTARATFLSANGGVAVFSGAWAGIVPTQLFANDTVYARDRTVSANVTTYCTAKVNSVGCTPYITSAGIPELSGNDNFHLAAQNVLINKSGVFFWGTGPTGIPFGGGLLCVKAPVIRTLVQNAGAANGGLCSGSYSFAFSQAYMLAEGVLAGDTLYGQFWSRDSGFAAPANMGLTDAVRFVVLP